MLEKRNKMKKAIYIGIIGNVFMLIGMLSSFLMIKTDEPQDYTAKIYGDQIIGPVKTEEGEEAQTDTDEDEEDGKEEEKKELKGYSYSLAGYLCQKLPDKEDTEDIQILQQTGAYMQKYNLATLNFSNEEQRKLLENYFGAEAYAEAEQVLKKYSGADVSGGLLIFLAVVALGVAVWLLFREDYRWSFVFSIIATMPLWRILVKLDGITQWQVQYGFFFYVAGLLAALTACLMGGNAEQ